MKVDKPLLIGLLGLLGAGVLGAAGYGLYAIGMQRGMGMATAPAASAASGRAAASQATGPQSLAQGQDATRRHIAAGIQKRRVHLLNCIGPGHEQVFVAAFKARSSKIVE